MPTAATEIDDGVRRLLGGRNVAHVVTRRRDGSPRVVVVWVGIDGDRVLLNGRTDRLWVADLRRDSSVVVTVVDRADPHHYVTIEGTVEIREGRDADAAYRELAVRYWGRRAAAEELPPGARVAFRVVPRRVRRYVAPSPAALGPPAG